MIGSWLFSSIFDCINSCKQGWHCFFSLISMCIFNSPFSQRNSSCSWWCLCLKFEVLITVTNVRHISLNEQIVKAWNNNNTLSFSVVNLWYSKQSTQTFSARFNGFRSLSFSKSLASIKSGKQWGNIWLNLHFWLLPEANVDILDSKF